MKIKIYKTIVLPVVLYGCETWSLTLREGRRVRVFENRVVRRIYGPKRDEVTGKWLRVYNEELNNLYSSTNIVRVINREELNGWGISTYGERRGIYRFVMGKPEGK